jgi:hypothetical protein
MEGSSFVMTSGLGRKVHASSLIIACGGRSYPALGSDGSAYKIAEKFGHKIIEPVPSAVPLVTKEPVCHLLQGQKIRAAVTSVIDGQICRKAPGELLFTKYGLSGTAILDVSKEISVALNRTPKKRALVVADLVPFMDEETLKDELIRRIKASYHADELLVGILPNKFAAAFNGILKTRDAELITSGVKSKEFYISGTRGWNEADFTAGGVDTQQVDEKRLESKLIPGLYFAGEILNVDGARGGYNLAWAWGSGFMAGLNA